MSGNQQTSLIEKDIPIINKPKSRPPQNPALQSDPKPGKSDTLKQNQVGKLSLYLIQ